MKKLISVFAIIVIAVSSLIISCSKGGGGDPPPSNPCSGITITSNCYTYRCFRMFVKWLYSCQRHRQHRIYLQY